MDASPEGAAAASSPTSPGSGASPATPAPRVSTSSFGWGSTPTHDPVAIAQRHIQTLHAELDAMRAQVVERDAALGASQREAERLRDELHAAHGAHQSAAESAATELAQLRARLRSLAGVADGVSTASQRAQRAGAAAARAAAAALQLERELGPLLVRVQAIRAEADAAAHAAQDNDDVGGASAGGHGSRSPLKPPGAPPSEAAVEWPDAAAGEEWPHADCDASSLGEDGGGLEATARKANSMSAAFDTLSVASLNTDDGRLTFTNSEYTTHLGGVMSEGEDEESTESDEEDEHAGGEGSVAASSVAASSPRHSEAAAAVRRAPAAWVDPAPAGAAGQGSSAGRVRFGGAV